MNNNEFLTFDHHLDLDAAFEEIKWLYSEYGLYPDEKLSVGGKELKQKILKFVDDVSKLPYLPKE